MALKAWELIILAFGCVRAIVPPLPAGCDVTAQTNAGTVCGKTVEATNGNLFASFQGMRYAKPPLKELRFAEPQDPEPFHDIFDASETGPICPQVDVIYGPLLQPRAMNEDCLRINVYVPSESLPSTTSSNGPLLPILFFIHGGSCSYGSGDDDLHGPEYLMAKGGMILVTFNYRLNGIGFLSICPKIPGNAGLRDALFALKWVQKNIKNFGGDPARVTLSGQSSGAAMAGLLAVSPATQGQHLFNNVMLLSGTPISGFYSYDQSYVNIINAGFMTALGLNLLKNPEDIFKNLTQIPYERIIEANKILLDLTGLVTFGPVIEKPQKGFTTIIQEDPEILLRKGYGKEYTHWLGFTSNEAATYRFRLAEVDMETKFKLLPPLTLPQNILFGAKLLTVPMITGMHFKEYFNGTSITLDKFIPAATDGFYKYPAMRVAEKRLKVGAKPTYISQFAYEGDVSFFQEVAGERWSGAGHCEDLTYFFRPNSAFGADDTNQLALGDNDSNMRSWMTDFVVQFVKTGSPVPKSQKSKWPPTDKSLNFQNIAVPLQFDFQPPTAYMKKKKAYFDKINKISRGI